MALLKLLNITGVKVCGIEFPRRKDKMEKLKYIAQNRGDWMQNEIAKFKTELMTF